jgi:hypothetical protein
LKPEQIKKLSKMRDEAGKQEDEMQSMVQELSKSDGFEPPKIEEKATETAEKASKIMETYLGEDPDTQEALEFLCLAEAGEVTHYEVLSSVAKEVKKQEIWDNSQSNSERRKEIPKFVYQVSKGQYF